MEVKGIFLAICLGPEGSSERLEKGAQIWVGAKTS